MYKEDGLPRHGDIYVVEFSGEGSVQQGLRPAVVFQNNTGNTYSPNVIVLPLTSKKKKVHQPTHVLIPAVGTGLARDSIVLCENPMCIPKSKLGTYITHLPEEYITRIAIANLYATSAIAFIDSDVFHSVRNYAIKLNSIA